MTDLFYIEKLETPGLPWDGTGVIPWHTENITEARFVAYSLNALAGKTKYQVKEFKDIPPRLYLDVPYWPQWGATANVRTGDCGPACDAMIVHFLTEYKPTVDAMATMCGQPATGSGSKYTDHKQLREGNTGKGGAKYYGVTLVTRSPYSPPQLDLDLLEECLDAGLPSIALIHYGVLRDETDREAGYIRNQDRNYSRGHWVVVIGMDKKDVYIHDPDFWGTREQDGNARKVRRDSFFLALKTVAPGCSVGFQGLVVQR